MPTYKASHRRSYHVGKQVIIRGKVRTLHQKLSEIQGGWIIDKPVEGFRYWNEREMRSCPRRRKRK